MRACSSRIKDTEGLLSILEINILFFTDIFKVHVKLGVCVVCVCARVCVCSFRFKLAESLCFYVNLPFPNDLRGGEDNCL